MFGECSQRDNKKNVMENSYDKAYMMKCIKNLEHALKEPLSKRLRKRLQDELDLLKRRVND